MWGGMLFIVGKKENFNKILRNFGQGKEDTFTGGIRASALPPADSAQTYHTT
jgi:hypothetical protein